MGKPDNRRDILLAEDDLDDVEIFEMALNDLALSYEIRHAKNGDQLLELLRERVPYILFLDIRMPCRDGIACIIEIRKHREYDRLPVIMYTSHQSKKIMETCFREGANFYMQKPDSIRELTGNLRKIFAIDWTSDLHFPPEDQFVISAGS
ncbi:MAG TPA: response regulator [Anseongella sp.]